MPAISSAHKHGGALPAAQAALEACTSHPSTRMKPEPIQVHPAHTHDCEGARLPPRLVPDLLLRAERNQAAF